VLQYKTVTLTLHHLHRPSFHHTSSLASGRYRREVPFQNFINFLSLVQTIIKPTQAPCYDYWNATFSCNNDVMRFYAPPIQLHHFRVIRLVAFWVQSYYYTVFVEFGNFTPTKPRVQQIVKPQHHITSSLFIDCWKHNGKTSVKRTSYLFYPADLKRHLEVNHAKLEDRQAFAPVRIGYWNVIQTHTRVGAKKY